jgi:hypothetical protein
MIEFEDMSLTDRREALWRIREVAQYTMNHERRNWFEGVKCLLTERDMPKSVTHPPAPSAVARLKFTLAASEAYGSEDFTPLRFIAGRALL